MRLDECRTEKLDTRSRLSLPVRGTPSLGHARDILALEVILKFADLLATLDPALTVCLASLLSQLIQCRPVSRVVIAELNITADRLHKMTRRNMLAQILVEFELLPGLRVDEGCDQLEKAPNHKWYCRISVISEGPCAGYISLTIDHQSTA